MKNVIFILLFALIGFSQLAFAIEQSASDWVRISIPPNRQTSQLDAGYTMGCMITTMLYALKFGPSNWKAAYEAITGEDDVAKITELVRRFSILSSRDVSTRPAFSAVYGMNPNDFSWMFHSLIPGAAPLSQLTLAKPQSTDVSSDNGLILQLRTVAEELLARGQPIIAQLYFRQPDSTHAVLITGITGSGESLLLTVLDPATGLESVATVNTGVSSLGGREFDTLNFVDDKVVLRSAILFAIWN